MFRKSPILLLLMMFLFSLSACSTVEGTAEASAIIETTVMPTEQTATPTELSVPMEETVPIPVVKTEFVLETIDGQDYYAMNGYRYSAKLGAPELGLEATAVLLAETDIEAAKTINNPGDAIHYLMEMEPFTNSRTACETFVQLLEDDYSDYGFITLQGNSSNYCLAYVQYYGIYYPIDVFNVVNGKDSWIMVSENECAPNKDAFILCENLTNSFPNEVVAESWIMESLTIPDAEYNPTKHLYPWELSSEDLGSEKVAELYEAGNHYAAERAITTLKEAIEYIQHMDPKTWFQSPMQGRPAWKTLVYMLADDYEDVGVINLMMRKPEHKEGFYDQSAYFGNYRLCYVQKDGVYYPIDIEAILRGWTSWTLLPGNACYSSHDLNDLCEKLAATFVPNPGDPLMTYWEITSYMYHNGTKMIPVNEYVIPEGLGKPLLSDEEIEALIQEEDYERIAKEITTLADALHFYNKLRLVRPRYINSNAQGSLEYFQSAWQVMKDKTAFGPTACSLTHYLLKEDYDEVGYVMVGATTTAAQMMYIYEDGLYYLLYAGIYPVDPREDLWIEWPDVIGCAEDFQTIADSLVAHAWFQDPDMSEQVKSVYLIHSEGDFVYGMMKDGTFRFPEGSEVTRYYGPDFTYEEATLDWQSQTRLDN